MDINAIYNGFISLCDTINKLTKETVLLSKGVAVWRCDGLLTFATFSEKIEKNILNILAGRYILDCDMIVLISKYFTINNIEIFSDKIRLTFNGEISQELLTSKNITKVVQAITKNGDNYEYIIHTIDTSAEHVDQLNLYSDIISNIGNTADYDRSVLYNIEDSSVINNAEMALSMNIGEFVVDVAKSLFVTINKDDQLSIRCIPYKHTDHMFIVMTTNYKAQCRLISIMNALKL